MRDAARRPASLLEAPTGSSPLGAALGRMRRHPVDAVAGLAAAAGTVMILFNALALQEGRHPAPFFGGSAAPAAAVAPPAPRRSDLVAQIQSELAIRSYYNGPVDGLYGARTSASIMAFEQASRRSPTGEATEPVLAALLIAPARKAEPAPPAPPARVGAQTLPPAKPAPAVTGSTAVASPRLMAVQRALSRLGYGPVTIDGKMGTETRNALLSFERDRKMPPTGEPSPGVLRELQAMTGAPLE